MQMEYPIFHFQNVSAAEFVKRWSAEYRRKEKPVVRGLYNQNMAIRPCTEESITNLLHWKNGSTFKGRFSGKKAKLVKEIVGKLEVVNQLEAQWDDQLFKEQLRPDNNGPIWKLFLLHVIQPAIFPIFDQHVYRAQIYLQTTNIVELSKTRKSRFNLFINDFMPLFNELKKETKASVKEVDEAMWAFGKFLKVNKQLIEA